MARVPPDASLDVQAAFRELWEQVDRLTGTRVDYKGVVVGGVGPPVQPTDAATKQFVDDEFKRRDL